MKTIKLFSLLCILLALTSCKDKNARRTNMLDDFKEVNGKTDSSVLSDKDDIQAAIEHLNDAIINPTESSLGELAADGLTYGHSSGKVQDKAEFIDDLINGDYHFTSINISGQTIHISGDVAVVRQVFDSEAKNVDEPVHIHIGNVLVFQKINEEWKFLARQAFKL